MFTNSYELIILFCNSDHGRRRSFFSGHFATDGYAVSVLLRKQVRGEEEQLPDLTPEDFEEWEMPYMKMWGADPGVSDIFVASSGCDDIYNTDMMDIGKRTLYNIKDKAND